MREKQERSDDDNQEREHRDEVDLSGIVTVVADFPAHCFKSSRRTHRINASATPWFPAHGCNAGLV
jgi:hypothetical protein